MLRQGLIDCGIGGGTPLFSWGFSDSGTTAWEADRGTFLSCGKLAFGAPISGVRQATGVLTKVGDPPPCFVSDLVDSCDVSCSLAVAEANKVFAACCCSGLCMDGRCLVGSGGGTGSRVPNDGFLAFSACVCVREGKCSTR